ncbi:MAG: bifunctional ornithine acetyltransferase/N-acetylglutamate synthase, partial [Epsilonproteobacteria bacterium]|nr:bifunctional ornithine acetyltransferase/N-acetylglutamate synthase [Campylobacterota bacterium]
MYKLVELSSGICSANGFYASGVWAGLRPNGADDMAFIYSDSACEIASVFTTNKMCAAPIRHFLKMGEFQTNFVLINAKNANAMTGSAGIEDIDEVLAYLKAKYPQVQNPVMSSTGVIGVRMPKEKLKNGIDLFDLTKQEGDRAARAIMTTDTFSKQMAFRVELANGKSFSIGGMAKGAGMINPAMATMLCFITT